MAVAQKCNISRDHNLFLRQGSHSYSMRFPSHGRDILPSMTSGASCPRAYAIVCTYEIVASIHGIVTIRKSFNEFSIHKGASSTVPALVMGA